MKENRTLQNRENYFFLLLSLEKYSKLLECASGIEQLDCSRFQRENLGQSELH